MIKYLLLVIAIKNNHTENYVLAFEKIKNCDQYRQELVVKLTNEGFEIRDQFCFSPKIMDKK